MREPHITGCQNEGEEGCAREAGGRGERAGKEGRRRAERDRKATARAERGGEGAYSGVERQLDKREAGGSRRQASVECERAGGERRARIERRTLAAVLRDSDRDRMRDAVGRASSECATQASRQVGSLYAVECAAVAETRRREEISDWRRCGSRSDLSLEHRHPAHCGSLPLCSWACACHLVTVADTPQPSRLSSRGHIAVRTSCEASCTRVLSCRYAWFTMAS